MPRFAVICPTYNRGPAIRATIASVLGQTLGDLELLVVSDASSDDTDAVVLELAAQDPRVRLVRTRRYGFQAGPTNEALAIATGDLVAYVDHDDTWHPNHLAALARLFDCGVDLAASRARKVDAAGNVLSTVTSLTMLWHPQIQLMNPLFENSCAAHRAGVAQVVGGWRESEIGLEDWDLWLRFADAGLRVATTLEVTVDILEDPGTRQNSLACPYAHEIARFDDVRSARSAMRALTDTRRFEEGYQACFADLMDWYGSLEASGELVHPVGWPRGDGALEAAVREHLDAVGTRWRGVYVDERADGWALCMVLGTMTPEHADRYGEFFRRTMRHQQEFFDGVLGRDHVIR